MNPLITHAVRPSRRQLLGLAAGSAAALTMHPAIAAAASPKTRLPTDQIEAILQAPGEMDDDVFAVGIGRNDIKGAKVPYTLDGKAIAVPFDASFQLGGEFVFQPLPNGKTLLNGDFPFLPGEVQGAIDAMLAGGLEMQSLHQHYLTLDPMVFFMHFRGEGDATELARAAHAVVERTGASLPQSKPSPEPTTPLDKDMLARIMGVDMPKVEEGGVVSMVVPRIDRIKLGGNKASPRVNISSNMGFRPLPGGMTAAAPDFAMKTEEIRPVIGRMRAQGWDVHCLYNQETGEKPQLYFAHMLKVGDAAQLAREIRAGLDLTATKRA